jgi:hypothetical protein
MDLPALNVGLCGVESRGSVKRCFSKSILTLLAQSAMLCVMELLESGRTTFFSQLLQAAIVIVSPLFTMFCTMELI